MNKLYLIEILHQTTTETSRAESAERCILLKFYIKPQLSLQSGFHAVSCILLKFYIKPQHTCICRFLSFRCILLKFYIKPQLN